MLDLRGKVAIVTGGSRGIGRATVLALASAGAAVVINYARNKAAAEELLAQVEQMGGRAIAHQADVTDFAASEKLIEGALDHFKRIDILINNAGITRDNLLVRMKQDEWEEVISTNLTGVYNCTRAVIRPLLKQKSGGSIINLASVAGLYGNSGQANYAAAKGGIIAFTRTLAKELGSRGITVNAVAPGLIETEMTATLPEHVKKEIMARVALGRFGKPEDVAKVVLFLASEGAAYITGQVIAVDGGIVM